MPPPEITLRLALLATVLATVTPAAASMPFLYAEGSAYDSDTGALLYREQHRCDSSRTRCSVDYRDASGALIARKELDYASSHIAPALLMENYRSNTAVRVPADGQTGLVVDAGFDNFVRQHWEALTAGRAVAFRFQPAGYDTSLDMVISGSVDNACATGELCLTVNADSWLIRALTDPIELIYTRADRTLLRYRGISNLPDAQGESVHVEIVYEYGGASLFPAAPDGSP